MEALILNIRSVNEFARADVQIGTKGMLNPVNRVAGSIWPFIWHRLALDRIFIGTIIIISRFCTDILGFVYEKR